MNRLGFDLTVQSQCPALYWPARAQRTVTNAALAAQRDETCWNAGGRGDVLLTGPLFSALKRSVPDTIVCGYAIGG